MTKNHNWSQIKYFCDLKNIKLNEISRKVGVSLFYMRKKIKEGDVTYYNRAMQILNKN